MIQAQLSLLHRWIIRPSKSVREVRAWLSYLRTSEP